MPRSRTEKAPFPAKGAGLSHWTRRGWLAAAGAALACGGRAVAAPGGTVTFAYPADVLSWDPTARITPLATAITESVFDNALQMSPDLKLLPGVANWRWRDKGARQLELTFREDVLFPNGDRLTAEDFQFTYFDRLRADPTLQLAANWNPYLEKIEVESATHAVMHFKSPMAWAPVLLAEMGEAVLPKKYVLRAGAAGFLAKPVGSGPYRLVDYQRNSRVVLEAWPRYWGGPARIRQVMFQIIPDATARGTAVQGSQADITINLSARETQRLGALPGLAGEIHPTTSVLLLHMANRGPFTDRRLRLAAHHAIDKAALSRAFFGGQSRALSMLSPPGTPAHDAKFNFTYDLGAAQALVKQAGFSPQKPVKVKLFTTNGAYASDFDIARAIVQMWKRAGIDADLKVVTLPEYLLLSQGNKFEGPALWNWYTKTGSPVAYGYILDPRTIFSVWKSPDVAARFAALEQEADYAKMTRAYGDLEKWAVSEGYTMPLLQGIMPVVHGKALKYAPFGNGSNRPYYWSAT